MLKHKAELFAEDCTLAASNLSSKLKVPDEFFIDEF